MVKCPKCGTQMVEFSTVRSRAVPSRRVAYSVEKILVTGLKCPKCGRERSMKENPLQKEKPKGSRKVIVQLPEEILSQ